MKFDERDGKPIIGETEYTHGGAFGFEYPPKNCTSSTCAGVYKYCDCKVEVNCEWVDCYCWHCSKCGDIWFQDEHTREQYRDWVRIKK